MDPKEYEIEDFLQDPSFCDYCMGKNERALIFWKEWIASNPDKSSLFRQAMDLHRLLNGNHTAAQFRKDQQSFLEKMDQLMAGGSNPATEELGRTGEGMTGMNPGAASLAGGEPSLSVASLAGIAAESDPGAGSQTGMAGEAPTGIASDPPRRIRPAWYIAAAVAASLTGVILFNFFSSRPASKPIPAAVPNQYAQVSRAGERKSFQLSDGSKVMLNAGSTIRIDTNFNETTREVTLEGEAFFDVTHNSGKPFIIHTAFMDIKVLGTAFNIRAYPADKVTETSLISGSVEVVVKNKDGLNRKIILHPNQKIIVPNMDDIPAPVAAAQPATEKKYKVAGLTYYPADSSLVEVSWTENRLAFDDNSFEEVAARLERWYNVSIRFDNEAVRGYRYTAIFDKKTISQVLEALQLSRHFDYEIKDGDQVVIK